MRAAEVLLNIRSGDLGELPPPLEGSQAAILADRAQQPAGQCARAGARFHHPGAGEDVGQPD